jgi:ribose transport system ATP-binding protein
VANATLSQHPGPGGGSDHGRSPQLEARHISKAFGGEQALDDVSLRVEKGEVHGLLGENGSGKSTLIKVLAGFHAPEEGGELWINGNKVELPLKPGDFRGFRMSFVHQHLALMPSLTVLENLLLPKLATARGIRLAWRDERARARVTMTEFGVNLDPDQRVSSLTQIERALLAIVRAATELESSAPENEDKWGVGLLILDEPTVFLSEEGLQRLFDLIERVVASGASVIFVSHDLDEVISISDRITVLRDGRVAGTVKTEETNKAKLVELIVGHELETAAATTSRAEAAETAVRVSGLSTERGLIQDVNLSMRRGEIVGLTGLIGSGFDEIPYMLYGAGPGIGGELTIEGEVTRLDAITPARALRAGVALIPANRQRDGSIASLSVEDNVMMQVLPNYFRGLHLHGREMSRDAAETLGRFDVRPNRPDLKYSSLSGGNQQKVVLAKWLQRPCKLLLLHEPTQGVDVGARLQIFELIRAEAASGTVVLCASSDHEQLELLCDRVLILGSGQVVRELAGDEVTAQRITQETLRAEASLGDAEEERA